MPKGKFPPAIDCTQGPRPPIALGRVKSSQISAIGYDADSQTLAVQFGTGGSVYHYEGFTPEQHRAFITAESLGVHLGQHILPLQSKKYAAEAIPAPGEQAADESEGDGDGDAQPTAEELEAAGQTRLVS